MAVSLLPDLAYELDGFLFGTDSQYIVTNVEYGSTEIVSNDTPLPRADGIRFGRDYRNNRVITFDIAINQSPHENGDLVLTLLSQLETAWLANGVRGVPGAVSSLRLSRNGRTRRVFGRPRRFATTPERDHGGWVEVTADFTTVDPFYYSDSEFQHGISIVPTQGGGLLAPLVAPLSTLGVSYGPGDVTIGGTLPCWPVFVIRGPIVSPKITAVGEWSFTLAQTLLADEWIVVDTRPWSRGVRKNGLANIAGSLDNQAPRLPNMALKPGSHEIVLSGTDVTGTANVTVAWRDTYASY